MICPKCKREFDGLACRICASDLSRAAFLEHQRQFIRRVYRGELQLHTCRAKRAGAPLHIEQFNNHGSALCGAPTLGLDDYREFREGKRAAPNGCCTECRQIFERILTQEFERAAEAAAVQASA